MSSLILNPLASNPAVTQAVQTLGYPSYCSWMPFADQEWASGMFKECEAAYSILSDEKTRQAYNRNLRMRAMPNQTQAAKNPIAVAIDMVARAASAYVPPDQMTELLKRMVQERGIPNKPVTLVDIAERCGLLKKKRGKRSA